MKLKLRGLLVAFALIVPAACATALPNAPALIPQPAELTLQDGSLRVDQGAVIAVPRGDDAALRIARRFARRVQRDRGLRLRVRAQSGGAGAIVFARRKGGAPESYRLEVGSAGARITAADDAGLQHASISLWQLMVPGAGSGAVELPALAITDAPRFAWRGLMLDVVRHFVPMAELRDLVDAMAQHKLNVLHLHLTDDQGWRLEIKRHPELTGIGAWRDPPGGSTHGVARYGGFYTQAQMRSLVAYASERNITIVPEFDMPGHAQAAVAALPRIGVDIGLGPGMNARPRVSGDWGVNPYLFNVDDATLRVVEDVLDEAMQVFPSTFIHVGGDEAIKDQWKASPAVQRRLRALGLHDEEALQSWFIERVGRYLEAHGRRLIGWDEILEGGLPKAASVMSWRGGEGAIAAARQGHDVVLAPAGSLYLDNLQSRRGDEPSGRLAELPIDKVYAFEPLPAELNAEQARHVLGLEAALWTEYMPSRRHREHAIYPRLAALAEVAWSTQGQRDFAGFVPRLAQQQQRYRRQQIDAADSAFAVRIDLGGSAAAALSSGETTLRLWNALGWGEIRYTLDGSVPSPASPRYDTQSPPAVRLPATVRATAFGPDGLALAAPRERRLDGASLRRIDGSELLACPGGELGLRVPLRPDSAAWAPVFNVNLFDACWLTPRVSLDDVQAIAVDATRIARNYGLAHDASKVVGHPRTTPHGELEARLDDCDGPLLARMPLPAGTTPRLLPLRAALSRQRGEHTLCLRFTAPIDGPLHTIAAVQLKAPDR